MTDFQSSTVDDNSLNTLITPEVFQDEFYEAIIHLARSARIDTVLEIGSSSGGGSTLAWVEGLRQNPYHPNLYCMEVSRVRWAALKERWEGEGFVECFLGSSVRPDQFPSVAEVRHFLETVDGPLREYPVEQVLSWLAQDLAYIENENVPSACISEIKRTRGIQHFGAVLIDGSEFTGDAELDEVYGAEYILLDDTQTYKCYSARQRLLHDPGYEMIADNPGLRNGYSIFQRRRRTKLDLLPDDTPIHFFTIVLNGEPFIRHHIEVLRQLPFRWHWHIVEGAAELVHDTAWSKSTGGELPTDQHHGGLSKDGTTAYLDQLASEYSNEVSIYRPPAGQHWDGKTAMVAEPLRHIFEECVLWQMDADELWTAEQMKRCRDMFLRSPEKAAAWFWCHYFVGPELVVASRNCYSQNPNQEWLRAWRYRPGMKWLTHEPPVLAERLNDGTWMDVAAGPTFSHRETEAAGLVFQHFAYVTEAQLSFKERYYGYSGAIEAWRALQLRRDFPLRLKEVFPWVTDETVIHTTQSMGVHALAGQDPVTGKWHFSSDSSIAPKTNVPTILVDGVFFQLNNTGISIVWQEILKVWGSSDIASRIRVLDRGGSAPRIPGIEYREVPMFDPDDLGKDSLMLQGICDELHAGVFISTYYSSPTRTPSVSLIYDMIPERLGLGDSDWQWVRKTLDIQRANRFVCISNSTATDLARLHPEIGPERISTVHLAAPSNFKPQSESALAAFRSKHGLDKDYLFLVGERIGIHVNTQGYKNTALAFRAWSLLPPEDRQDLLIVCAGGRKDLEEELRILAPHADVRIIRFTAEELPLAYAGAVALVYPSLYEGFGLPVVEAMACGCPVITCRRASIPEVAGEAALYVDPWDPTETASSLLRVWRVAEDRMHHIRLGIEQAAGFSYQNAADLLAGILAEVANTPRLPALQKTIWESIAVLQADKVSVERSLRLREASEAEGSKQLQEVKHQWVEAQNRLKATQDQLITAHDELRDMKARRASRRRRPLRRIWDFIRRKKG
jgi:glycosyltransferase involved in cell wall biosynthesis